MDTIFGLNERHLGREAVTLYESLDDAGVVAAAVNVTCYRGRTRHRVTLPGLGRTTLGPRRFFYYNLFESDETGAPLAVRRRSAGTVDEYAAAVGRWLVTRDGFDFLLYYLSDYDYASHLTGPDAAGSRSSLFKDLHHDVAPGIAEADATQPLMLDRLGDRAVRDRVRTDLRTQGYGSFGYLPSWDAVRVAIDRVLLQDGRTVGRSDGHS